jgi:hypothetical protein
MKPIPRGNSRNITLRVLKSKTPDLSSAIAMFTIKGRDYDSSNKTNIRVTTKIYDAGNYWESKIKLTPGMTLIPAGQYSAFATIKKGYEFIITKCFKLEIIKSEI